MIADIALIVLCIIGIVMVIRRPRYRFSEEYEKYRKKMKAHVEYHKKHGTICAQCEEDKKHIEMHKKATEFLTRVGLTWRDL